MFLRISRTTNECVYDARFAGKGILPEPIQRRPGHFVSHTTAVKFKGTNRRRDIHHWHAAFPEEIRMPMASRMAVLANYGTGCCKDTAM